MTCHLTGTRPSFEPMLEYCQSNQTLGNKLQWNLKRHLYILIHEVHLKLSSAKWRLFRLGLIDLKEIRHKQHIFLNLFNHNTHSFRSIIFEFSSECNKLVKNTRIIELPNNWNTFYSDGLSTSPRHNAATKKHLFHWLRMLCNLRADSRLAPNQWETSLQSNTTSHWLGANLKSPLRDPQHKWHYVLLWLHKQQPGNLWCWFAPFVSSDCLC